MIQRYDLGELAKHYASDKDNVVCRAYDVEKLEDKYAELEAKNQKLLREHTFMIGALQWIADDGCTFYKKKQIAINSLRYVNAEVTL